MQRGTKTGLTIFCICFLFLGCTIRSGVLVDRSFLPRFTILSLVLMVTWIVLAIQGMTIRKSLAEISFFLFWCWSLFSTSWAVEASEALLQTQLVFLSFTTFLVISALLRKYPGSDLIFFKVILFVLVFSFGLAFYKMSKLAFYNPYQINSISANNNLWSGFLLISIPLVIAGYIRLNGIWKLFSWATGILAFFFLIIVQTRAAYLGTAAALTLAGILLIIGYREVITLRNLLSGTAAVLVLAASLVWFTYSLDNTRRQYFLQKVMVWNYFRSYEDLQAKNIRKLKHLGNEKDHSKIASFDFSEDYYSNANLRMIFWGKSAGLIKRYPLCGVGAGNWRLVIPSVTAPQNPEHTIGNYTYSEPHNEWIRILSELGIIGFVLATLLFFVPLMLVIIRIIRAGPKPPVEVVFYAGFIAGFYVFCMFDFPLRRVEHNIVLWSVFALMLDRVPVWTAKGQEEQVLPTWVSYGFIGILFFTLILSLERIRGEYYTIKMFRNERKEDIRVVEYSRKAENPFYHITPNTLPLKWFEGVADYRLGKYREAEACFLLAKKMTPYEVRLLNDFATTEYALGKKEEAVESLNYALNIDPFFDDARFNLGAIYFLNGERAKALTQIIQCRDSQKKRDYLSEMR